MIEPYLPKRVKARILGAREQRIAASMDRLPYVDLQEMHIANLKMLPTREHLLEHLPKGGLCCEVGVNEGDFSEEILRINRPSKLTLIDA